MEKLESRKIEKRPYQREVIKILVHYMKDLMNWLIEYNLGKYKISSLIEMATWSWKTFTVWSFLDFKK